MKYAITGGAIVGAAVGMFFMAAGCGLGYALFAGIIMGSVVALVAGSVSPGDSYADTYPHVRAACTPSRGHTLTSREEFAQRELVAWAATAKAAPSRYVAEPEFEEFEPEPPQRTVEIRPVLPAAPVAIPVPNWPVRQVAETEEAPIVVNRMAARFSAIEYGSDKRQEW